MSPNESSNKDPDTAPDEVRSADDVKAGFDKDPADVSDGTEATPGPVGVEAAPDQAQLPDDQDELRRQIEETRAELGDTVEALSAKADVKGQAQAKVDETKIQAKAKVDETKVQAKTMVDETKVQAKTLVDETTIQAKAKVSEYQTHISGYQAQAKENPKPVAAAAGGLVALLVLRFLLKRRRG